jgi:hypothetical protein
MTETALKKERFSILFFYGLCTVLGLIACIPTMSAQNIGVTGILVIVLLAYLKRSFTEEDSLEHHHLSYIIRTIWIYTLFASIGMLGAGWRVWSEGNNAAIDTLTSMIEQGSPPTEADIDATVNTYLVDNHNLIMQSMIMWMLPSLLYFAWRIVRGLERGWKNYRVQNIYAWF